MTWIGPCNEDGRAPWLALLAITAAILVSAVATAGLPLLNFLYVPVLFVAYWSGPRAATLIAFLCLAFVFLLAKLYPDQFASGTVAATAPLWLRLAVWGSGLALAGYVSGRLLDSRRGRAGGRAAESAVQFYNIGTLAIIKGYLRHDQVLKVLQIQQKTQNRFGEIAIGLRLLTPEQVDELLRIQQERRAVTSTEIAMAKLELAKARKDR